MRTVAQFVLAGSFVLAALGAATAGLAVELVRRGVLRVWRWV